MCQFSFIEIKVVWVGHEMELYQYVCTSQYGMEEQ